MSKNPNYSQAIEELENIVSELENENVSVEELSRKVKRASELISICKTALHITEQEVKNILEDLNREENKKEKP